MADIPTAENQNILLEKAKTELLRLEQLRKNSTQFGEKFQQQIKYRQQLQSENESLKQQCRDLEDKQVKQNCEYAEALQKFSEIDLNLEEQQDLKEKLFYILLGFRLTSLESIDTTEQVATLHYNDECFVKLKIGGVHADLLQIQPMHPNFDAIRQMAQATNNISGLLANLRKFFDIVMKQKKNAQ